MGGWRGRSTFPFTIEAAGNRCSVKQIGTSSVQCEDNGLSPLAVSLEDWTVISEQKISSKSLMAKLPRTKGNGDGDRAGAHALCNAVYLGPGPRA